MDATYWNGIRAAYAKRNAQLLSCVNPRIDPYFFDWKFTPIENSLWADIRGNGAPFFPQYPVLDYFLDFANPYLKIGIEADGKQWHDREKDKIRDERLLNHGWRIFRVTGKETYVDVPDVGEAQCDYENDEMSEPEYRALIEKWLMRTSDGVVRAINHIYVDNKPDAFGGLMIKTLNAHKLSAFNVTAGYCVS